MILLDAGPSERGFSRLSAVKTCPQLFAYRYRLTRRPGAPPGADSPIVPSFFSGAALTRGSLVHVGLAHYYARRAPEAVGVPGVSASDFYAPLDAVEVLATRMHAEMKANGTLTPEADPLSFVAQIQMAVERFTSAEVAALDAGLPSPWAKDIDGRTNPAAFSARPFTIVGMEQPLRVAIRRLDRRKRQEEYPFPRRDAGGPDYTRAGDALVRLLEAGEVPLPGEVLFTQRLDLLVWRQGRTMPGVRPSAQLIVVDHKTTSARKRGDQAPEVGYSLHGQFWGARLLAQLAAKAWWPDVDVRVQVQVQLLELDSDPAVGLHDARVFTPEPADFAETHFAEDVMSWEEALARWDAETVSGTRTFWTWPKLGVENGCLHRYGKCPAWDLCRLGPAALRGFAVKEK